MFFLPAFQLLRNPDATVWVGNLDQQANEELMWELMTQVGPVVSVGMPRDRITTQHQGYAFCEFETPEDADYAIRVMNNIHLFGKMLRVNKVIKEDKATREKQGWQANVFVGNLDQDVDETILSEIFGSFGALISVRVERDDEGKSKGFGFLSFDTFESADAAIEAMDGQYVYNRQVNVNYAYKKDGLKGERHGSEAERRLAKGSINVNIARPQSVSAAELSHVGTNVPRSAAPPAFRYGSSSSMGMAPVATGYNMSARPPPFHPPPSLPPPPPVMSGYPSHMMMPPPPPPPQRPSYGGLGMGMGVGASGYPAYQGGPGTGPGGYSYSMPPPPPSSHSYSGGGMGGMGGAFVTPPLPLPPVRPGMPTSLPPPPPPPPPR